MENLYELSTLEYVVPAVLSGVPFASAGGLCARDGTGYEARVSETGHQQVH